ncbi:glycosyltransferase family 8 protein [Aerococcaceae bacterium zg-ZUI334]|uniref:glycosyltransferase family 8 protein n=1 Tax=Aerococcaceae bacterium zg-252 TaxID=2796928 RepID=UPI001BA15F68|nr:glycosyltransferase family 8 protein [Aerococcaceae bacterium zg-ZUI334]
MQEEKKYRMNIAMAADYRVQEQVEVTLKSIIKHNKRVQFFLINTDYPKEWFDRINSHLHAFESIIHDKKVIVKGYEQFSTYDYITEATFYRYHISEEIREDKILYLDADIVVTGNLDPLYNMDITNYALAAVEDVIVACDHKRKEFNAGVMLINNTVWRQENILQKALELHGDTTISLPDADQSVLNILFKDKWLAIDEIFNYQVAAARLDIRHRKEWKKGLVIHYTTSGKPYLPPISVGKKNGLKFLLQGRITWLEYFKNKRPLPFAEEWHQVNQLTWKEIEQSYDKEN